MEEMKKKKEVPGREKAETWMRKGVGLMIILDQGEKMELRTKMMMIRQEGMTNGWDQHYSCSRSNDDDGGGGSGGGSGGGETRSLYHIRCGSTSFRTLVVMVEVGLVVEVRTRR